MMSTLIGITTLGRHYPSINNDYYDEFFVCPAPYVDAVRLAGGTPVLIPPGEPNVLDIIAPLHGVIIAGGVDIHPSHYDGVPQHAAYSVFEEECDQSDLTIARRIVETNKPTFAVCRGMQVVNVALGGTLYPHIPDIRENDIHRKNGAWAIHDVTVEADSQLAQIMGTNVVRPYSSHHQAVNRLGEGLRVVAEAPDGIVEAVAHESHPWLVAVQWHPEASAKDDATQQALFNHLVEAARLSESY